MPREVIDLPHQVEHLSILGEDGNLSEIPSGLLVVGGGEEIQ